MGQILQLKQKVNTGNIIITFEIGGRIKECDLDQAIKSAEKYIV